MPVLAHGQGNARERPDRRNIVLEEMANCGDKSCMLDMEGIFGLKPARLQVGKSGGF